jgi:hypothetical protein
MKEIILNRGGVVIVDDVDYERLNSHKWSVNNSGYAGGWIKNRKGEWEKHLMHRLILIPYDNLEIDHINGDKLDNQRSNLRLCTRSQNCRNNGTPKTNTSGYKGVYLCKQTGRWAAQIKVKGKKISLGRYSRIEEAAHAYNRGALKHHGEFARLNTI